MQFTNDEMRYFSMLFEEVSPESIFKRYREPLDDTELYRIKAQLASKQLFSATEDSHQGTLERPVDGMMVVLNILAFPSRSSHFSLQYPEGKLYKAVYASDQQRILLEFLDTDVVISIYDTEAASVRQEISNQTGVSFQKVSTFKSALSKDELTILLSVIDILRLRRIKTLLPLVSIPHADGQAQEDAQLIHLDELQTVLHAPAPSGIVATLKTSLGLEAIDLQSSQVSLSTLVESGFFDKQSTFNQGIYVNPVLHRLAQHFLLADVLIRLELTQMPYVSRELILQGSLKQALAISTTDSAYEIESLTGIEILNRIDGYLSCPILSE